MKLIFFLYFCLVNSTWLTENEGSFQKILNELEMLQIKKCTLFYSENSYRLWLAPSLDAQFNWTDECSELDTFPRLSTLSAQIPPKRAWLPSFAENLGHEYFSWSDMVWVCMVSAFSSLYPLKTKFGCQNWRLYSGSCLNFHTWSLKSAILFVGFV